MASKSGRKEWVKARYVPKLPIRVTVTVQDGQASASWSVDRYTGYSLKEAVADARRQAHAAVTELLEAMEGTE